MNDVFKREKIIWEAQIRSIGKKYQAFNYIEKLPEYKIRFVSDLKIIKYAMQILNKTNPITLNINIGFMLNKSFDFTSTTFHEFTHICDYTFLLNNKDDEYKESALSLYTEFHASYIQSLFLLGISDINNNQKNDISFNKLEEKITNDTILINENIYLYKENINVENFDALLKSYMYYYGAIVAYNNWSKTPKCIKSFDFEFNEQMELFYSALKFNVLDEKMLYASYMFRTFFDKSIIKILYDANV